MPPDLGRDGAHEAWSADETRERTADGSRRGAFGSVQELIAAINDYLTHHNADPKPFVWTTTVDTILDKVRKCRVILWTHH